MWFDLADCPANRFAVEAGGVPPRCASDRSCEQTASHYRRSGFGSETSASRSRANSSWHPLARGPGKRLFAEGTPAFSSELVSTQGMQSGIVLGAYKVTETA